MARNELPFPFGGLNDSEAATDPPEATTTEAVNVRPFDPTNAKRRGAQRSGLVKFADTSVSNDKRVQALVPVSYDQTRLKYTQLTAPTKEWEKIAPDLDAVYGAATDSKGNVYVINNDTYILKYNSDGERITEIPLLVNPAEVVVNKIVVDEFDSVFVAFDADGTSRVIKFDRNEDDIYDLKWELFVTGTIRDFEIINDTLYAICDEQRERPSSSLSTASQLFAFSGTSFDEVPVQVWARAIPGPANSLAVNSGSIYVTGPPEDARNGSATEYGANIVDWSPLQLNNVNSRIHFWVDAGFNNTDSEDGEEVTQKIASITSRSDYEGSFSATDTTERYIKKPIRGVVRYGSNKYYAVVRGAPTYESGVFNQMPAWRFRNDQNVNAEGGYSGWYGTNQGEANIETSEPAGRAITSSYNEGTGGGSLLNPHDQPKTEKEGSLPYALSPIPGYKDNQYIFAVAGKVSDWSQPPCVILTIQDGRLSTGNNSHTVFDTDDTINFSLSIILNLNDAGTDEQEGYITVHVGGADYQEGGSSRGQNARPFDLKTISPRGDFIITVAISKETGTNHQPQCCIRANGRVVDAFELDLDTDQTKCQGSPLMRASRGSFGNNVGWTPLHNACMHIGGPSSWAVVDYGREENWRFNGTSGIEGGSSANYLMAGGRSLWTDNPAIAGRESVAMSGTADFSGIGPIGSAYTQLPDSANGNLQYFDGYIAELITVLANHGGGATDIHNQAIDQPKTSATPAICPRRAEAGSYTQNGTTEVEKLEGYFAHKYGFPDVLETGNSASVQSNGLYLNHAFATAPPAASGQVVQGFSDTEFSQVINSPHGYVVKLKPTGFVEWAINAGGTGYGIAVNEDKEVFTVGPASEGVLNPITGAVETYVQARKFIDLGKTYSFAESNGAWTYTRPEGATFELAYKYPQLYLDSSGNLYWPKSTPSKAQHVQRLDNADGTLNWQYSLGAKQQVFALTGPPKTPEYDNDLVTGPEFLYIASDNGSTDGDIDTALAQLTKIRLVSSEQIVEEGTSPRATKLLAIADGDVVEMTPSGATSVTGGTNALGDYSRFVSGVAAFQKVYLTDGLTYKVYDPKKSTVSDWTAGKAGSIPPRCKLASIWRGRIVLARDPENPHDWHMSAMGDPDDWDQEPATYVATMSISGNNSRAGQVADIVNALIPYNDDLLLFGCDSKIYRLTGDPMAGGQIDLVSDTTGVAFGNSWCKDPEGMVYFFGSRGGVYAMSPQGQIQSLSNQKIERRLQDIDLAKYRVELIWNDYEQGLHVIRIPYDYKAEQLKFWYWDRRHNAWFEDELSNLSQQFTAAAIMDGDSFDDRELVFGCEDGKVRQWSKKADDDDGSTIDSRVLIGPILDESSSNNFRFNKVIFELASEQNGANYEFDTSRPSDEAGSAVREGRLSGGPNDMIAGSYRGANAWIRLRNSANNERWAFESVSISVNPAGRKRI